MGREIINKLKSTIQKMSKFRINLSKFPISKISIPKINLAKFCKLKKGKLKQQELIQDITKNEPQNLVKIKNEKSDKPVTGKTQLDRINYFKNLTIKRKIMIFLSPALLATVIALALVFIQYQSLVNYQAELEKINKIEKQVYHVGWKVYELSLYESKYVDTKPDPVTYKLLVEIKDEITTNVNEITKTIDVSNYDYISLNEEQKKKTSMFIDTTNILLDKSELSFYLVNEKKTKDGKPAESYLIKGSIESKNNLVSVMIQQGVGVTNTYKDAINHKVNDLTNKIYYLLFATVLVLILVSFIASHKVGKMIEKDIKEVNEQVNKMASGNLSISFNRIAKDEVGSIKENLLVMNQGITQLVKQIDENKNNIEGFSTQLLERSNLSEEYAKSLENHIETISDNISEQNNSITDLSSLTQELSASMEQIAASIELVSDNAGAVSNLSNKGFEETLTIEGQMNNIFDYTLELNNFSIALIDNIKLITNLSGKISEIADQTKILSLNATIEAARAGDVGRGFAVVAKEVRNLATQTSGLSDEINKIIKETEHVAQNTLKSLDKSINQVNEGKEKVSVASNTFRNITDNIKVLNDQINEIVLGIRQVNLATEETVNNINTIANSSEQLSLVSNDVLNNAVDQSKIAKSLNEDVELLKQITNELNKSVDQFKL